MPQLIRYTKNRNTAALYLLRVLTVIPTSFKCALRPFTLARLAGTRRLGAPATAFCFTITEKSDSPGRKSSTWRGSRRRAGKGPSGGRARRFHAPANSAHERRKRQPCTSCATSSAARLTGRPRCSSAGRPALSEAAEATSRRAAAEASGSRAGALSTAPAPHLDRKTTRIGSNRSRS